MQGVILLQQTTFTAHIAQVNEERAQDLKAEILALRHRLTATADDLRRSQDTQTRCHVQVTLL